MDTKIKIDISIEGTPITYFSSFNLEQRFNEHHTFHLRFNHDQIENTNKITLDKSKEFIGKNLNVQFGRGEDYEHQFVGKITSVDIAQSHGFQGDIVLSGFSPSILIDRGPDLGSYLNKNLKSIVEKATADAPENDLSMNIAPTYTSAIDYIIQYRESDFEFINRLSAEYHEWFYYDGIKLNFGKPSKLDETTLIYGRDLHSLQYGMKIAPLNYQKFSYHSQQNELLSSYPQANSSGSPDLLHAIAASNQVYSKRYNEPVEVRVNSQQEIDTFVNNEHKAIVSELLNIMGNGDNPRVKLGCIVNISTSMRADIGFEIQDFGKFLVTAVYHQLDGVGHYQNTFEGVPADSEKLPVRAVQKPLAEMQLAKVVDNNDPQKQGRIKVKFKWQCSSNDDTEWLRVVTPSAGNYSAGSNNRGFIAIPEVDDQVLIGFEEGNIARPVVIGSVYHNDNGDSAQQIENNIKSISTRSGVLIQINDTDSQGSVTISDPSGNTWYMDGAGNITVSAPGNLTLNAGENITLNAGQNIVSTAGENINSNANLSITKSAGENIIDYAGALMTHTATEDYNLQAANIKKVATGNISVEGKSVSKQASEDVHITSTNGNINKNAQEELQNNSGQSTKHN
jgi:type VI secretion system secreted protein VgrG